MLVVVYGPCVQDQNRVLWNQLSVVNKVFGNHVWSSQPKGIVASLDFFDDGPTVWEVLLILGIGQTVSANNTVQLVLGATLDFRV